MTPTPAELAAASCNLINEAAKYFNCKKYQLDCCMDLAKEAWALDELANSDCELGYDTICSLRKIHIDQPACSGQPTCSSLLSMSLKSTTTGGTFTTSVENELDQTAYMSVTLTPNSVVQPAEALLVVTDSQGEVTTYPFTTGSYYDGITVNTGDQYHPSVESQFLTPPIIGTPNSYFKTVRLYKRSSDGAITSVDVNVAPDNIWACPSCSVVNSADLYLDSYNLIPALKAQIENYIRTVDGDLNASIQLESVANGSGNSVSFTSKCKHQPTGNWWGFSPTDFNFVYHNQPSLSGPASLVVLTNSWNGWASPLRVRHGSVYFQADHTTPCESNVLTINSVVNLPQLNTSQTTLFNISLTSPITTNPFGPLTVSGTVDSCTQVSLQALISTSIPYSITWYSPTDSVLGTTSTVVLDDPSSGVYKAVASFSNGDCEITKEITI